MAPPPAYQRFNAKARGGHKKGKQKSTVASAGDVDQGGSGDVDLDIQSHRSMSSKKRKRLDSYIAKKLLLERRNETLKSLVSLQPSTSTSLSLYSTASLGQNPLKPTSARDRQEVNEDRLVRRNIHRLSKQGHGHLGGGESSGEEIESDGEERSKGKGKGKGKQKAVEVVEEINTEQGVHMTVLPTNAEKKQLEKNKGNGTGKYRMPKKANWNPSLLRTQPESESDFDSSDSANDSVDEDNNDKDKIEREEKREDDSIGNEVDVDVEDKGVILPSKSKDLSENSPISEVIEANLVKIPPPVLGGALKVTNGAQVQPRFIKRGAKRFLPTAGVEEKEEEESDDEDTAKDLDEDDDEDEEENEDDEDDDDGDDDDDDEDDEDEDEEGDEEEEEEEEEDNEQTKPKRSLGFKAWALQQMSQTNSAPRTTLDPATTSTSTSLRTSSPPPYPLPPTTKQSHTLPKTGEFIGPLGTTLTIPSNSLLSATSMSSSGTASRARPTIKRRDSVNQTRMELPILAEEQNIVEAILMHPVVVICGETGSGKTTQVPQMLYEAGFGFPGSDNPGMIAVTQPRRVAAVSLAVRVKSELNLPPKSAIVAHQIRYSSTSSSETAIKFMTDGVILRELSSDFLLSRYSIIVVDEAHERGVNTDVLIGVLSRVAKLREKYWREGDKKQGESVKPLRIVIMSATLRVSDFVENSTLFNVPPPVIHIGARQHPVTIHFSRKTQADYVNEAYKKVCKIHARLPPGGVLVFMTGQSEIMGLCRKLEKKKVEEKKEAMLPPEVIEAEDIDLGTQDIAGDVDDGIPESDDEALDTDEEGLPPDLVETSLAPMHVLPLYSLLSNEQQMAVFKPPPEGSRLVIVATNVAETSLTIPGIRYVVDCGRAKERQFDVSSGVQSFAVNWISKASASQRAGRAGRTGPGHCYRLYSSALYEDYFPQFSKPEILRMPIEGVVLQMKSMNIDSVSNFPFPTPPDRQALLKAETLLQHLGALEQPTMTSMINGQQVQGKTGGRITELGRKMAEFPVSPRFAKMLAISGQHGCADYIVAIVSGLSVGNPFVHVDSLDLGDDGDQEDEEDAELHHIKDEKLREKEERKDLRRRYFKAHGQFMTLGKAESDMFKLLAAVGAYEYDPTPAFCAKNFLRHKAMQEIQQLRSQISTISNIPRSPLTPPNATQLKVIRQILTSGFIDQIAVLESLTLKKGSSSYSSCRNIPYRATGIPEPVYIHPSSALYHKSPAEFIVFTEVVRTSKVWVKGVTKVNPAWLSELGKSLCSFSRPVEMGGKKVGAGAGAGIVASGEKNGDIREVVVIPHFKDLGVDLPPVKRKQRREGTRWVMLE